MKIANELHTYVVDKRSKSLAAYFNVEFVPVNIFGYLHRLISESIKVLFVLKNNKKSKYNMNMMIFIVR